MSDETNIVVVLSDTSHIVVDSDEFNINVTISDFVDDEIYLTIEDTGHGSGPILTPAQRAAAGERVWVRGNSSDGTHPDTATQALIDAKRAEGWPEWSIVWDFIGILESATNGIFYIPTLTSKPTISTPTYKGIQYGLFTLPDIIIKPIILAPNTVALPSGTTNGSLILPLVNSRPVISAITLKGTRNGILNLSSVNANLTISAPTITTTIGIVHGTYEPPSVSTRPNVLAPIISGISLAPTAPALNTPTADTTSVTNTWAAVSTATSYKLYWTSGADLESTSTPVKGQATTANSGTITLGNVLTYQHTGLTTGLTYKYVGTTVNVIGESVASAEVSATTAAATIIKNPSFESVYNPATDWVVSSPTNITGGYCSTLQWTNESDCMDYGDDGAEWVEGGDFISASVRAQGDITPKLGSWYHKMTVKGGLPSTLASAAITQNMTGANFRSATGILALSLAANVADLATSSNVRLFIDFEALQGATQINRADTNRWKIIFGDTSDMDFGGIPNTSNRVVSYASNAWQDISFDFKTHVTNNLIAGKTINDISLLVIKIIAVNAAHDQVEYIFYADKVSYQ